MRPLRRGDLRAFVAYRRDPGVARYQSWDVGYSLEDAQRLVAEQDGTGLGAAGVGVQTGLIDRRDGSLVGDCYSHVLCGSAACAEVGITIAAARQGLGFAGEALTRLIGELFRLARSTASSPGRRSQRRGSSAARAHGSAARDAARGSGPAGLGAGLRRAPRRLAAARRSLEGPAGGARPRGESSCRACRGRVWLPTCTRVGAAASAKRPIPVRGARSRPPPLAAPLAASVDAGGRPCVRSIWTARRARGSSPSRRRTVGATWVVSTGSGIRTRAGVARGRRRPAAPSGRRGCRRRARRSSSRRCRRRRPGRGRTRRGGAGRTPAPRRSQPPPRRRRSERVPSAGASASHRCR